ncbi:MAG: sodium:calcium antiporter [Patescibacteria group bacterium]
MVLALLFLLLFFSALLIKAADMSVVGLRRIARQAKLGVYAVSAIILAIGTSFPELSIGVTSALNNTSSLSLGVIIGSNIANIALIGAIAALIHGKINVHGDFLRRDFWIASAAGILPVLLILDRTLSSVDGLILLAVYLGYSTSLFKDRFAEITQNQIDAPEFVYRFWRTVTHIQINKTTEIGKLFLGIALMLFSADVIVKVATIFGQMAGIPVFVVGLVVLAIGTSLPEFAFSLRSLQDGEPRMFFGNLLGSIIANSTLIVGLTAVINPIKIHAVEQYFVSAIFFVMIFVLFWLFVRSKHRLDRWEAVCLLILYLAFVVIELTLSY